MHELKQIKTNYYLRHSLIHLTCICLLSLGGLLSCGLEAYYYIDYIPQGYYRDMNATINLPSTSDEGYSTYFKNFIIFYRIYTSAENVSGEILTPDIRARINSTLNSDFNSLYNLTDITSTSVSTSNLETTFDNRYYFKLTLEGGGIDNVLGRGALGGRLDIFFNTNNGVQPTLSLNGNSYALQRAKDSNVSTRIFEPQPDRRFLNHPDLYDSDKAFSKAPGINADVAAGSGDIRYTYVSMYIAAVGQSLELPPRTIYSQPTFIGIFRLADWS